MAENTFLEQVKKSILKFAEKEIEEKDYVIEVKKIGDWNCRTWRSGKKEASTSGSVNLTSQTWSGAGLGNTNRFNLTIPLPDNFFENQPYNQLNIKVGSGFAFIIFQNVSDGKINASISANVSGTQPVTYTAFTSSD